MKTDVWMPLYIGDYLKDTMHLSRGDHGAYLLLIMAYWNNQGPLPDEDDHLASVARVDKSEWPDVKRRMQKFFNISDGLWNHGRIDGELEKAKLNSDKCRKAAEKRWGKPDAKAYANALPRHMLSACTSPSPSPVQKEEDFPEPKTTADFGVIPSELNTPEFLEAWEKWKGHLRQKGKPYTILAEDTKLLELKSWGQVRAIAAINHSMGNNYQGLFEPNERKPNSGRNDRNEGTANQGRAKDYAKFKSSP